MQSFYCFAGYGPVTFNARDEVNVKPGLLQEMFDSAFLHNANYAAVFSKLIHDAGDAIDSATLVKYDLGKVGLNNRNLFPSNPFVCGVKTVVIVVSEA